MRIRVLPEEYLTNAINGLVALAVVLFALLAGCRERQKLCVCTWSDYINPALIEKFERENDCKVVFDAMDDNETLLAKLESGGTDYDIVFPSSYIVPVLVRRGLAVPLETNWLGNVIRYFDPKYRSATHEYTMRYSVPFAFSMTGIAYRADKVGTNEVRRSWEFLKSPVLKRRVSLFNDMREVLGIGLKLNGRSANSSDADEIKKAVEAALALKAAASRLDSVEYRIGLANGAYLAAMSYNSDIFQMKREDPDLKIAFFVPDEGGTCCWDEMVVLKGASSDLAHKFINFLYDPENAAENIAYACSVPNVGLAKLLPREILDDELAFPSEKTLSKLELIRDVGDALELYSKAWDVVTTKSASGGAR